MPVEVTPGGRPQEDKLQHDPLCPVSVSRPLFSRSVPPTVPLVPTLSDTLYSCRLTGPSTVSHRTHRTVPSPPPSSLPSPSRPQTAAPDQSVSTSNSPQTALDPWSWSQEQESNPVVPTPSLKPARPVPGRVPSPPVSESALPGHWTRTLARPLLPGPTPTPRLARPPPPPEVLPPVSEPTPWAPFPAHGVAPEWTTDTSRRRSSATAKRVCSATSPFHPGPGRYDPESRRRAGAEPKPGPCRGIGGEARRGVDAGGAGGVVIAAAAAAAVAPAVPPAPPAASPAPTRPGPAPKRARGQGGVGTVGAGPVARRLVGARGLLYGPEPRRGAGASPGPGDPAGPPATGQCRGGRRASSAGLGTRLGASAQAFSFRPGLPRP